MTVTHGCFDWWERRESYQAGSYTFFSNVGTRNGRRSTVARQHPPLCPQFTDAEDSIQNVVSKVVLSASAGRIISTELLPLRVRHVGVPEPLAWRTAQASRFWERVLASPENEADPLPFLGTDVD